MPSPGDGGRAGAGLGVVSLLIRVLPDPVEKPVKS